MKKFACFLFFCLVSIILACHSPSKTGNAQADSGSYGHSGPTDTTAKSFGTKASGTGLPSSGSDTSTTGH